MYPDHTLECNPWRDDTGRGKQSKLEHNISPVSVTSVPNIKPVQRYIDFQAEFQAKAPCEKDSWELPSRPSYEEITSIVHEAANRCLDHSKYVKIHYNEHMKNDIYNIVECQLRDALGKYGIIPASVRIPFGSKPQGAKLTLDLNPATVQSCHSSNSYSFDVFNNKSSFLPMTQTTQYAKSDNHYRIKRTSDMMFIKAVAKTIENKRIDSQQNCATFKVLVYDGEQPTSTLQMFAYLQKEYPHLIGSCKFIITQRNRKIACSIQESLNKHGIPKQCADVVCMSSEKYLKTHTVDAAYTDGVETYNIQRPVVNQLLQQHILQSDKSVPFLLAVTAKPREVDPTRTQKYIGITNLTNDVLRTHHVTSFHTIRYNSTDANRNTTCMMTTTFLECYPRVSSANVESTMRTFTKRKRNDVGLTFVKPVTDLTKEIDMSKDIIDLSND